MTEVSWNEANRSLLTAEFARLKQQLGYAGDALVPSPAAALELFDGVPPAIDRLCEVFGLTLFERDLVLLCAGIEMDSDLAARGQGANAPISFGLAMGALPDPHWSALTPARPLRRFQILRLASTGSLTATPLRIDERILHFIAGTNLMDLRLDSLVHAPEEPLVFSPKHRELANRAAAALEINGPMAIHLCGNDASGQDDVAHLAASEMGLRLIALRVDDLPAPGQELDQLQLLLEREMLLLPAALLLQCDASGLPAAARRLAETRT